ncbi:MAG: MGMT family protein [Sandaracinus sp.]|nr:MGMT family protein [Sandaracinus sp.]MCB9611227.1 MGMT family protein [Sandaracinus sp.]MCB9630846.1 MGMT family protein [Sandaracinus sp.]
MSWDDVYAIVRAVPEGRVTTYGDVAKRLTRTISPAAVGWALAACPDDVPWQRVVRADGSLAVDADGRGRQRRLLEREGVRFDDAGRVRLKSHRQKVDET